MILLYGTHSLGHGSILFIFDGVIGGVVGIRVAPRISGERGALTALFATVLFAVAAYMLYRSGRPLLGSGSGLRATVPMRWRPLLAGGPVTDPRPLRRPACAGRERSVA